MEYNLAEQRITPNIITILEDRYLMKDSEGKLVETPDQMYLRVAKHVANGQTDLEDSYYKMMALGEFHPNSPTLVNAGANKGCLSACFVRSPEDDMNSIMDVLKDIVMIEKWGGGIGVGVSKLRSKGAHIGTVHGQALGPVNVLKMISYNASMITQGSFRRGAHMGQLIISHPDIREFIHCKDGFDSLQNFNISVQITDAFMEAVIGDLQWDLIDPHTGLITETLMAKELWQELCDSAHATGDPGIAFIDRVWETQPNPQLGDIMTSNPCGEEYLEDGNSCCLGSINLSKFVVNGQWDYARLDLAVHTAVGFLNGVIDVNEFAFQALRDVNLATRRIGLGIMGWADALISLGIPYDSQEALNEADNIGSAISTSAWDASANLAIKDGPYPEWKNSAFNIPGARPVRNSSVITIAPTGTISRLADCSSGIEPLFDLVWESNILWKDDTGENTTKMVDCAKGIREALVRKYDSDKEGGRVSLDLLETHKNEPKALLAELREFLDPEIYQTALNITPKAHLNMQAMWQKHTSNAVSKTINAPNDLTADEIREIYLQAWQLKCKGVTVYRSGTREVEVLSSTVETGKTEALIGQLEEKLESDWGINESNFPEPGNIERPDDLEGITSKWNTGHGRLLVTTNWNGKPHEVILTGGKAGGCDTAFLETIARLISMSLQKGISYEDIVYQLTGITCCPAWHKGQLVLSPSDGVAKSMKKNFEGREINKFASMQEQPLKLAEKSPKCQKCNGRIIQRSGCAECESCGYGKCD
jgi:ribonucleoside-diphosphate reductase alpha chain